MCIFVGGAKGVSALQQSRYRGCSYKTAYVLNHKLREAMQRSDLTLGGVIQIDGCTIGGYRRYENTPRNKFGKRFYKKKFDNRRVVTVARESFGNTRAFVGKTESDAIPGIIANVRPNSVIQADGSSGWNGLATALTILRNDHEMSFKSNGVDTNMAESYFSLLRRMQYGVHHKIGGSNLEFYANELAWRQDNRELTEHERISLLLTLCLAAKQSEKWSGYWQKGKRKGELKCNSVSSIGKIEVLPTIFKGSKAA